MKANNLITSNKLQQAMVNPGAIFSSPHEVLTAPGLSNADKIRVLRSWQYDCAEMGVAEEEGMPGSCNSMLQPVLLALAELADVDHDGAVAPSKQHGPIT